MSDDPYSYMAIIPADDADDGAQPIPRRMSPSFTLAYLRECKDGAMLLNREGRISFINDAAIETLHLSKDDSVSGKNWWEVWPAGMENLLQEAHSRTLEGEAVRFTTFLDDVTGEAQKWDVMTSPVVDNDGMVDAVFCIVMPAEDP